MDRGRKDGHSIAMIMLGKAKYHLPGVMHRFAEIVCLLLLGFAAFSSGSMQAQDVAPVVIDYFYEPGCPDCIKVKNQIMPELEERFEGFYVLNKYDLGIKTNIIKLVAYQEKLGVNENKPVSMYVDYQYVFNGFDVIKSGLFDRVDECVASRMEPGWVPPEPVKIPQDAAGGVKIVKDRVSSFTTVAVILAGLTDGINPCAIATLVFFMSLLAVSKVKGRGLLLMGIPYCLASFITYTALGFGLLRALHLMKGFEGVRMVIEWAMIGILGVFAILSFRDAYRFKKSGKAGDVTLQLPDSIKKKIHKIMREGIKAKSLIIGGFFIGILVTALESVCTGQVYVPTLVLMIKESSIPGDVGELRFTATKYLLLYNLMFIMPLVVVFVLTYMGLRTEKLLEWSRQNVVVSKILLGCLFIMLGILMFVL